MRDAGRNRDSQRLAVTRVPRAFTRLARVAPHLATAPASTARGADRQFQRNGRTGAGLVARQVNLRAQSVDRDVGLDKRVPHPLDLFANGGKIDRDFVGKRAIEFPLTRRRPLDRDPRVVYTPVLLHGLLARSVGGAVGNVNNCR